MANQRKLQRAKIASSEPTPKAAEQPLYVTWASNDDASREAAYASYSRAYNNVVPIQRTTALNTFRDIAPNNVSIRDGFNKADYDYFRPDERTPRSQREVVAACMSAYDRIGLVRNVVDLMADFACKGIRWIHPIHRVQRFYRHWFKKVAGVNRTERILNCLYRAGNVVIHRHTAMLSKRDREKLQQGFAAAAGNRPQPGFTLKPGEVPWQYSLINPVQVEVIGGELAPFVGPYGFNYSIRIPDALIRKIKMPSAMERQLVQMLPQDIRQAILDGARQIQLDKNNVVCLYYKRDDWMVWANPMLYAILDDLVLLRKLKLADIAALDGAISHIRLWRLGSLEHQILPTEMAINRLSDVLTNNVGGGAIDLVWGPELDFKETGTDLAEFLGDQKYGPTLNAIYEGLGVPPTLTGTTSKQGTTNNFISLKTLTERLEYGRDVVMAFWLQEAALIQQSMGFRQLPTIQFDRMSLTDEQSEKALLIQLTDRGIISEDTVLERFGEDPDVERWRRAREMKARDKGQLPPKASPFHTLPAPDMLKNIFAQSGAYAPSQFGLDLLPKKKGEQSPNQAKPQSTKPAPPATAPDASADTPKPKDVPGKGRPQFAKDTKKRKKRTFKPRSNIQAFVQAQAWAEEALATVAETVTPAFLKAKAKKNLRQLTVSEAADLENFKFAVLCNVPLFSSVSEASIRDIVANDVEIPGLCYQLLQAAIKKHLDKEGKEPTVERVRKFQAGVVAMFKGDFNDTSDSGDSVS